MVKSVDNVDAGYTLRMSMSGYTKLFNSILASTVWNEPMETRIVWITLLAMADKHGIAEGSVPGLAVFARIPIEATRAALERLSAPDPDSRSKDENGRRIEAVEGGWRLVNHSKYRAKMGADERREYLTLKQREYRKRKQALTNVNNVSDKSTLSTHAEAEAYTDTKEEERTPLPPTARLTPIQSRRRKDAAWEGPRVYVPQRKHNDFVALRNHPAAADELFTWYERISEEWATGRHAKSEPGSNMLAFWDARYAEQWPATVQTPTTAQRRPAWAVKP